MKILRLYKIFSSIIMDLSAFLARSSLLACVCHFYTIKHPFLYDDSLDGYVILVLHAKKYPACFWTGEGEKSDSTETTAHNLLG